MTQQEKLLDKLAKIQAHAESAKKIGSEAEAEAFAAMLQQLMLKHKIAMSEVQFADLDKDEPIHQHYMDYKAGGIPPKKARSMWQERLASIVARAHFCRILVTARTNRIILVGRESDCVVAEYTFMVLARAITKLSNKSYDQFYYQCEKKGETYLSAGYKRSFIDAFVDRLGNRFNEEKEQAEATSSTALVRVETANKAIEDYMDDKYSRIANKLSRNTRFNRNGATHGRAAADNVNLHGKAVGGRQDGFIKLN
tara:strand:- start:7779 stop:8540 length:762 start_codon:yes stop_codon:yes gene_type:complete